MRHRGNDAVAPSDELFEWWQQHQQGRKWSRQNWKEYRRRYLNGLNNSDAIKWMQKVAQESGFQDVILVCFEKDHNHCHRTLLARDMALRHPEVNYVGELRL
jgi:uncharacterized protein YeaO (DUF488 family)